MKEEILSNSIDWEKSIKIKIHCYLIHIQLNYIEFILVLDINNKELKIVKLKWKKAKRNIRNKK